MTRFLSRNGQRGGLERRRTRPQTRRQCGRLGMGLFFAALVVWWAPAAMARTQVGNICTVYGQKETPVIGIGLVVGLSRTGDGAKNAAAMRALASTLRYLNNPVEGAKDLSD